MQLRAAAGIYDGLILGYPAKIAALVREKRLDKLSETMDSARDFRVFKYAPLARYPAEGVAGYSVVELNRCAVACHVVTICDFPPCLFPASALGLANVPANKR